MADVKRSVVITPEQDAFIDDLAQRHDVNRSWVVRQALARAMKDPQSLFLPSVLTNGESTDNQQPAVAAGTA